MPLSRLIARTGLAPYLGPMAEALIRFFALAALVLMPLGMSSAPVMAAAPQAADHCQQEPKPAEAPAQQQAHCTGCAALPAVDQPPAAAGLLPEPPRIVARSDSFAGIILEIATPPPKLV